MKIYANAVPVEGLDLEEDISPDALGLETEHIHYPSLVNVKVYVSKEKNIINADCRIKAKEKQVCSMCLAEFECQFEKTENFVYELSGEYIIDLNNDIRDAIILDYPMKMLCKPGCKGLCISCGKNLNEGPCSCKPR